MPGGPARDRSGDGSPRRQLSQTLRLSAIATVPGEQQPQATGELIMLCDVQRGQDPTFCGQQLCQRRVHCLPARFGQLNQHAAPIIGVILPGDQPARGEPVHPVGHRPRRDHGFPQQLPR